MPNSDHTIALIAHDGKKAELIAFVKDNHEFFQSFKIVATGTTGKHIQKTGLRVKRVLSGPLGGDAQIAALVATGKCQAVIFMRDPLGMHPHEPDISMLLRICEVHDIPLATNPSTAQLIIKGLHQDLTSLNKKSKRSRSKSTGLQKDELTAKEY